MKKRAAKKEKSARQHPTSSSTSYPAKHAGRTHCSKKCTNQSRPTYMKNQFTLPARTYHRTGTTITNQPTNIVYHPQSFQTHTMSEESIDSLTTNSLCSVETCHSSALA